MTDYPLHNIETAPEAAKPLLQKSLQAFGMIPNLHAVMATSPQLLDLYQQAHEAFQNTSFNAEELTVVWQTINVEHACHYCVPAHTAVANMMKVDSAITDALRNETPLDNAKLEALRTFTLAVVRQRGNVTQDQVDAFFSAGYGQQQILEVIVGAAQKVMSNYVNHIAHTAVDAPFQKYAWEKNNT